METLDRKRQPLLELAISGRHRGHSLWLLTQSYTAIPKNLRRQKKMLFVWYPNEKSDLKTIDEETNIIDDLEVVKKELKSSKYACLYIRLEYPRSYKVSVRLSKIVDQKKNVNKRCLNVKHLIKSIVIYVGVMKEVVMGSIFAIYAYQINCKNVLSIYV